jgi:hypothetical protein
MSSPVKKQPEVVVDRVLKRLEISKVSAHPLCDLPAAGRGTED